VQRSSPSIAALATALAKAQTELANPEKSLTGTIEPQDGEGGARQFRYAPLSSGLEIVRKTLGQHEIATVQTTAIDHGKAKLLAAVRLDIAASTHLRDAMLGELNAIGSEDAATKWAQRRLAEKNKLNATDAKHIEEAFRAKLLSFAIHHAEGVPDSKRDSTNASTSDRPRAESKIRDAILGSGQIGLAPSRAAAHSRS
jgi:hypothetical protein